MPISPSAVAAHLSCGHLTQLERKRREGTLRIEFATDPRLEALQERGLRHEAEYVARLRAEGRSVQDLRATKDPSATLAAMREGVGAIVQAPLANVQFSGIADVLLRCESPSSLGAYSYEPVETKLARDTRASAILQLMTYCELVEPLQGKASEHVHVVTPLAQETYVGRTGFAATARWLALPAESKSSVA